MHQFVGRVLLLRLTPPDPAVPGRIVPVGQISQVSQFLRFEGIVAYNRAG